LFKGGKYEKARQWFKHLPSMKIFIQGEALGIIQQLLGPSPSKGKSRSKIQHAIGKNENYD
jgi:hypothetical protein